MKASFFWDEVIQKNKSTESQPTRQTHQSNISVTPAYCKYTEEEWNKVLTDPLPNISLCIPPDILPIISTADRVSSMQPQQVSKKNFTINSLGKDSIRDPGEMTTMPKTKQNTHLARWYTFGVVYGAGTAI
eukprot:3601253-Ditylum_brightwellii.AAC.1